MSTISSQATVRPRMLTGDRPTGDLHLGHLVGTIANRVRLQHEYESFFIIADLHMLTTRSSKDDIALVDGRARGLVLDAISAGIEPGLVTFYLQSAVPPVHELAGLLQSLVTVARLERLPALKDMARDTGTDMSFALLGYPVLQSADILSVRATAVPVGKDNYAFVEVCRELARRFNARYGEVFPVPDLVESQTPVLVGTDGQRKMSKSLGNAIALNASTAEVTRSVNRMYTDPARVRADIPGSVEGNPVFAWLDAFAPHDPQTLELKTRYREGRVGDVEVKAFLIEVVEGLLRPMRIRRAEYAGPGLVDEVIVQGTERIRAETTETVRLMRSAMGLSGSWNRLRRRAERRQRTSPPGSIRPDTTA